MNKGLFITFEGGEGVGKTSVISAVSQHLQEQGITPVVTREPGGTPTANKIRSLFNEPAEGDDFLKSTEAFLVSAARAQHVGRLIKPGLAQGQWILCDRFADSTRVYQGALGELEPDFLETLIHLATGGIEPDITFVLDCDPKIAFERRQNRDEQDGPARYDNASEIIHQKIRSAFLKLAEQKARMKVIDASGARDSVLAQVMDILNPVISDWRS